VNLVNLRLQTLITALESDLGQRRLLLVASILSLTACFLLALYVRLQEVLIWGWYLRAFDPYIRYYLGKFLVDVGIANGLAWWISGGEAKFLPHFAIEKYRIVVEHGYTYFTQFWYPWHINWARVLSPGVSLLAALTYIMLSPLGLTYHEAAILSPAIFNALTALALAYIVWRISHPEVRLHAAVLAAAWGAVSPLFTMRGTAGWLDDVAFFQFFAVLALAFTIEAIMRSKLWERVPFLILAFLTNGFTTWIWGSYIYLFNMYGLAALALSLYVLFTGRRLDLSRFIQTYLAVYLGFVTFILLTPRYGVGWLSSEVSLIPHVATTLSLLVFALSRLSEERFVRIIRTLRLVLAVVIACGVILAALSLSGLVKIKALTIHGRYLSIVVPLVRPPLIRSVAEHAYVTPEAFFEHVGITAVPVMISAASLLATSLPANVMLALACISASYFTMSMMFLLYLLAVVWIPVALYSLSVPLSLRGRVLPLLLLLVSITCISGSIISTSNIGVKATVAPPEIISQPPYKTYDWIYALEWLKYKTPENAAVVSWWDYGYWISVVANRTSLADNSTVNATQIVWIARLFLSDSTNRTRVISILNSLGRPKYILVYMPYTALYYDGYCVGIPEYPTGGDFAKSYWMATIAGYRPSYVYSNLISLGVPVGYTMRPNLVQIPNIGTIQVMVPYTTKPLLYRLLFSLDVLAESPQCDKLMPAWVFQKNVLVPIPGKTIELRFGFPFYEGTRTNIMSLPSWIKLAYEPYVPREFITKIPVFGWVPIFRLSYG